MKAIHLFCIYFGVAFSVADMNAQSGWFWQNPPPQGNLLYSVSFTNANTGTLEGNSGTILRTTTGGIMGVWDNPRSTVQTPTHFALERNYPNPFNPRTNIKYELPRASQMSLTVYNVLGREVSVLVNERRAPGVYEVKFDGSNLASGVYFYRGQAGNFVQTKRLTILK